MNEIHLECVSETCLIGERKYKKGARDHFPEAEGREYIRMGWFKCVETGECGDRVPGAHALNIQPLKQDQTAS